VWVSLNAVLLVHIVPWIYGVQMIKITSDKPTFVSKVYLDLWIYVRSR